jgi:acyl transferase domain-containing protein
VPAERWGRASRASAGLLADVRHFDPEFFGIELADARAMDPQALIVLEEALNAIHHAGYTMPELRAQPVGVFVGGRCQAAPSRRALAEAPNATMAAGQNYLAANVSRVFDLRGPSLVVDTACSSALTAMSIAAAFLGSGKMSAALVGGVGMLHTDAPLRLFERRGILQPDGRFHIFDARAAGAVLGEGAGFVMLKRLSQALADGDRVYGVLEGIALNNDGRTAGPTAPNLSAQKLVLQEALARSGLSPAAITHVEVNGSGSEVTDLLELKAIESVYAATGRGECDLGSVKPNIGHPLCAEGMASFIKVVLMLHHRQRVPFLSGQEPMKHYDFAASPFRFRRAVTRWPGLPAAAINCFADGGTNAHVVVQAAADAVLTGARRAPVAPPALARREVFGKPPRRGERLRGGPDAPAAVDFGFWGSGMPAALMEETSG